MSDEITGDLDLLGDWLAAKGYTEELAFARRAMDEINKLRAALKQCDEAMAWELGGEPIDTLMIEARRAARAAIEGEKDD